MWLYLISGEREGEGADITPRGGEGLYLTPWGEGVGLPLSGIPVPP